MYALSRGARYGAFTLLMASALACSSSSDPADEARQGSRPDGSTRDDAAATEPLADGGTLGHGSTRDDAAASKPQTDGGTYVPTGGPAPALSPKLRLVTYLGGANDQYVSEVSFDAAGHVLAKAGSATLTYDPSADTVTVDGDVSNTMDLTKFPRTYPLPMGGLSTNMLADPRNGQTYTWGTHPNVARSGTKSPTYCTSLGAGQTEVAAYLQMAFFKSSAGYKLWDFGWDGCLEQCQVADSRAYDAWLSANDKVGLMLWTDGGDTPLVQDPKDVSKKGTFFKGSFGEDPGGMGTLFALIDPSTGNVESGTWLATHTVFHTQDEWGRVYTTKALSVRYGQSDTPHPTNPFSMSDKASSGLLVLRSDFRQPDFNAYLGGDPATCAQGGDGVQQFDAIALHGNLLALAGTTCVTDLPTSEHAVQKTLGGGQDGFVVVVQLW